MQYVIVDAQTSAREQVPEEFIEKCNALIKEGYSPHGSLAVVYKVDNGKCHLYQAFVRLDEGDRLSE